MAFDVVAPPSGATPVKAILSLYDQGVAQSNIIARKAAPILMVQSV
jgi:hypothetical protein